MKILIVTEGFFPGKKYGGPPVSVDNFCSLMEDCECYIITHDHDLGEKVRYENIEFGWNNRGNCKVLYLKDREYNSSCFEKYILEIKPDIIYLQSLFQKCVFSCLYLANKHGIKVLLAPRGELCKGAFKKKFKKIPYILLLRVMGLFKNIYFQSTSDEETQAIKRYLKTEDQRVCYLNNIPSIPKQEYEFSEKQSGVAKFVFLSRIHPKKNLIQAIKCLKNVRGKVYFDIYGPLEDENYWEICKKEIENLHSNVSVCYRGIVTHEDVHKTFSKYDAFIFPTFSENYGHVIVEALISGCPVIISDQTPWNDVEEAGAGYVCDVKDIIAFENAVQSIVDTKGNYNKEKAVEYAQEHLNLKKIKEDYSCTIKAIAEH